MGNKEKFDDGQIEGQITIDDIFSPPERLFAVSRIFARARKSMNLAEQKTFVYALSMLKFKEETDKDYVMLDKHVLANILGLENDYEHFSTNLYRTIKSITKNSYVEFDTKDLETNGFIITAVTRVKDNIRVRFNKEYMHLFTGLLKNPDYITMWSADIFQMKSVRSIQFYEFLRNNTDTREKINYIGLGVKELKELFDIPKDGKGSYMRKDGHFDRPAFEKAIIEKACDDLKNCRMINLVVQPDGKMYEKVKSSSRVLGYRFFWTFSAHPAVATAAEVKTLQDRVDKDPAVLKVAKDIAKGEKKPRKKSAANAWVDRSGQREHESDYFKNLEIMNQKKLQDQSKV